MKIKKVIIIISVILLVVIGSVFVLPSDKKEAKNVVKEYLSKLEKYDYSCYDSLSEACKDEANILYVEGYEIKSIEKTLNDSSSAKYYKIITEIKEMGNIRNIEFLTSKNKIVAIKEIK